MIIPHQELAKDTLINLIKEYVLREGTDYGELEVDLEQKVEQVLAQLDSGEAVIVYSELHETVNIMPKSHFDPNASEYE